MIVVTAASGQLGRRIVRGLLETVPPQRIACTTRRPDRLAEFAQQGVTLHTADYEDSAALDTALAGAETVMFISSHSDNETRLRQHTNVVNAASRAGARHIVYTSFYNPTPENPFPYGALHGNTEALIRESGAAFTFLRDNFYADSVLRQLPAVRESGALRWPASKGRTSYVARDDVAAVAVAVLTGTGHENQAYDLTGPEALTDEDVAAALGRHLGTPVPFEPMSLETYREGLLRDGAPEWAVEGAVGSFLAIEKGYCDGVSEAIPTILGRPALSVKEVLARYG